MMYWGHVTIVWCFVATCTCVVLAEAIPIDMFYPFGPKHGDRALAKGFVERSERLRVEEGFNYLGSRFYNVWVSNIAIETVDAIKTYWQVALILMYVRYVGTSYT